MGLLLLMMTIGGLLVAAILLIFAFWKNLSWLKKFVFGSVVVWFAFFGILLFGSSLLSEEKTLKFNEPKNFCGAYLDCHLHTAVIDVRRTKKIGDRKAEGEFYIVKVKVFSDAKQAKLGLERPKLQILDESGKIYERIKDITLSTDPFERKVPAGGDFEAEAVFDLPLDVKIPRLDIREGTRVERMLEAVLIGDEDSIMHKRKFFKLENNQMVQN